MIEPTVIGGVSLVALAAIVDIFWLAVEITNMMRNTESHPHRYWNMRLQRGMCGVWFLRVVVLGVNAAVVLSLSAAGGGQ